MILILTIICLSWYNTIMIPLDLDKLKHKVNTPDDIEITGVFTIQMYCIVIDNTIYTLTKEQLDSLLKDVGAKNLFITKGDMNE